MISIIGQERVFCLKEKQTASSGRKERKYGGDEASGNPLKVVIKKKRIGAEN